MASSEISEKIEKIKDQENRMQEAFMREAIRLAAEAVHRGTGGPFGAVVVHQGKILSRGANIVTSAKDPTAHAEIVAIRAACQQLDTFKLTGCELYTSCEPCPMCLSAIYWARLERVYFASTRTEAASIGFDDEWLYQEIGLAIEKRGLPLTQMLQDEARQAMDAWRASPHKVPY